MFDQIAKKAEQLSGWWLILPLMLFLNMYSYSGLTVRPAIWYDEGLNIEMARNFATNGRLDIAIAPDQFDGGAIIGSTGYTVTLPLAFVFKIFGFGLVQARLYMLVWLNILLISIYFVIKKRWGILQAFFSTALLTTFAPLYANGNSVMGEIPGLVLFTWALYFYSKKSYYYSGLLLGLAVISKPSVYIFFIPSIVFMHIFENISIKVKLVNLVKIGAASAIIPLLVWFLLYGSEIKNGALGSIGEHFKNPYESAGLSVSKNIVNNLSAFPSSSTLVYFTILLVVIVFICIRYWQYIKKEKDIIILSAVYIPLVFFQYLKSLGYLRYLVAAECIILILLTITLFNLIESSEFVKKLQFGRINIVHLLLGCLVILQGIQLFYFSDLYRSSKTQDAVASINYQYPGEVVGIINLPTIASLIPANKKFQLLETYGLPLFGVNPLELIGEKMPKVLIVDKNRTDLLEKNKRILDSNFIFDKELPGGILVYKKI